jgi:DNA-directed RNA polymerase specialized sigma24 family protein
VLVAGSTRLEEAAEETGLLDALRAGDETALREPPRPCHAAVARVIALRDAEGMSVEEACELPGVSEVNQLVLPHRAGAKIRATLESEAGGDP